MKRKKDPQSGTPIKAPAMHLLAREARIAAELPWFLLRSRSLRELPRGDGHPVLIVPGFGADDLATLPLRKALRDLGYDARGWGLGRNMGMRPKIKAALNEQLQRLHAQQQSKVTLIGWSLGGVFVREMARHQPDLVRQLFTLGSPINGEPDANNMMLMFRIANRGKAVNVDRAGFERRRQAPPVPCTSIYSKTDGIVAWRCCLEEPADNTENVEVSGSHFGLVYNLEVLRAIAHRLAHLRANRARK
jgi:pimeloyl-ACP methyl ester carboxylesterase